MDQGASKGVSEEPGIFLSAIGSLIESIGRRTGRSHYRHPLVSAARLEKDSTKPLVLLVTGSMIVSDFFDAIAARLQKEGFRTAVYQPPDLLTEHLEVGARNIGEAVETILAATGDEKLTILAECNGGVASRYWLQQFGGHARVDRFITFVSAHHGTKAVVLPLYCGVADVKPGSPFLCAMEDDGVPEGGPPVISIYMRDDEIMWPSTTSRLEGALNIEVRDQGIKARARKRKPYRVRHLLGASLIQICPVHLAGFFDEPFHDLLVSCLKDDPEAIKAFEGLDIEVS
jgi:triacylglycerol lipase